MANPKEDNGLEEARRIMERLVKTPPKPHVKDSGSENGDKRKSGGLPAKNDRPEEQ